MDCVLLTRLNRAPNIIAEAVAVSLLGFFSGPFFASVCISRFSFLGSMSLTDNAIIRVYTLRRG